MATAASTTALDLPQHGRTLPEKEDPEHPPREEGSGRLARLLAAGLVRP